MCMPMVLVESSSYVNSPQSVIRHYMTIKKLSENEDGIILDGPYWTRFNETKMLAYACRKCCVVICPYRRPTQADAAPPNAT